MNRRLLIVMLALGVGSPALAQPADPAPDASADPDALPADPNADPAAQTGEADPSVPPAAPEDGSAAPADPDAPAATAEGEDVPWGDAEDVALPSFLDTTDRRIVDDRPAPTADQVAALRELEAEVARFEETGQTYRNTVNSLLRREYLRQRRGRSQWYDRQIREEDHALTDAREAAIRQFERFVRRYPDDPVYTPDAMFRLGELYFERSAQQFQDAFDAQQRAAENNEEYTGPVLDSPDFTPTIELFQRLAANFPEYRRIDGVFYLIGYCLNENAREEEARMAYLNLVCANRYTYRAGDTGRPAPPPPGVPGEDEHPPLGLDPAAPPAAPPYQDPYIGCEPVMEDARFVSETWFRLGEYHFDDFGGAHALDLAISAYSRILENPEDRNYSLALYKVAWTYYRASRYPEAVRHFAMLVQWSDDMHARTGRAGSDLRPEAIQYLGISFAYDDWNENNIPDPEEGMPRGIGRVQDGELIRQDAEWTPEVYFQLGSVYFDEAKYPLAIEVWRLALERWPDHHQAPELISRIAEAHRQHNQFLEEMGALGELTQYTENSDWWNHNTDHPREQREAERLAEEALIRTAIHHHVQAQRLRGQCVEMQDLTLCRQAQEEYLAAATGYRGYLNRYPNNPEAYELRYNLADALYWSESYEESATEYAAVRDSNLDDTHMSEAARRVVEALKRLLEAAESEGRVVVRTEAPEVTGDPPRMHAHEMPEIVQRLAQAREFYLARVDEEHDSEQVRAAYDFNNALLLYFYGYWDHARTRLHRILEERCSGPLANQMGSDAWANLFNMASTLEDTDEIRELNSYIQDNGCTFGRSEDDGEIDCDDEVFSQEPICIARQSEIALIFRDGLEVYTRADEAQGAERVSLFERAASMLVNAVNRAPDHQQAPIALELAATALVQTNRFDSAARLYQRIVDEVGPQRSDDEERQAQLDRIVSNAYFQLAYNANRSFDFERALTNYRVLADSPRFASSEQEAIRERTRDALINSALTLQNLQRYDEATEYYRRVYRVVEDAEIRRSALYSIAEMAYRRGNRGDTLRTMREFIQRYGNDGTAGELVVQAYWRIAEMLGRTQRTSRQQRDYRSALQDVVEAYDASGQPPGSLAAEYAAHARFTLVDDMRDIERWSLEPGRQRTIPDYVNALVAGIAEGAGTANEVKDRYEVVLAYRRPEWTIGALVRQGRAYEILARAVLNAPVEPPEELEAEGQTFRWRDLPEEMREEIMFQVEDAVRQTLDTQARPIECLAVVRYSLAARAARQGNIDDEYTRIAIDRLQTYGEERIAQCIAEAQAQDTSLAAYEPGEFSRAPLGRQVDFQDGVSAPGLTQEVSP